MATVLHQLFSEKASALYGAAVKLHSRYGIDLDDVVQEVAIAALATKESYGFVHVNTAVNRARDALTKTYRYGVNRYYGETGVSVCSYDRESTPEGDAWVVAFADEGFDWGTIDTALTVTSAIERIEDPTDRAIAEGYRDGMGSVEIGGELGIHYSTVIKRRQRNLAPFFSEFV